MSYKSKILTVIELKKQSAEMLHERVQLLCEIASDPDFRADLGGVDDFVVGDALNEYLDDTPFSFLEASWFIKVVPDVEQWKGKSLRALYDEMSVKAKDRSASEGDSTASRTRWSVSRRDYEELLARCEAAESRANNLSSRLKAVEAENKSLKQQLKQSRTLATA